MTQPVFDYPDINWCPDCGEPRSLCQCADMNLDGEPDFTLDDLEWEEAYPELCYDDDDDDDDEDNSIIIIPKM